MSAVPPIAAGHWEGTVQQFDRGRLASEYVMTLDLVQNGSTLSGTERIETLDANHYYEERHVSGAITLDPSAPNAAYRVTLTDGAMIDENSPAGSHWFDCIRTFLLPANPSQEVLGNWSSGPYRGTLKLQHVDAAFNAYWPTGELNEIPADTFVPVDMPPVTGSLDADPPEGSSGTNNGPAVNNSNQIPPTNTPNNTSGVTDSDTTDPHDSVSGQGYLKATITHNELVEDPGEPFSFPRLPIEAPGDAASGAADAHRSGLEEAGRIVNLLPDTGNAILGGVRNLAGFYGLSPEQQDSLIEDFVDTYGTGLQAIQNHPGAAAQIYGRSVSNMTNDAAQIGGGMMLGGFKAKPAGLEETAKQQWLRSAGSSRGEVLAPPDLLERMATKVSPVGEIISRRQIIWADEGTQAAARLKKAGANALFDGDSIILQRDVRLIEAWEEYLHGTQKIHGLLQEIDVVNIAQREVSVKEFMIRYRRLLGISDADASLLRQMMDPDIQTLARNGIRYNRPASLSF